MNETRIRTLTKCAEHVLFFQNQKPEISCFFENDDKNYFVKYETGNKWKLVIGCTRLHMIPFSM